MITKEQKDKLKKEREQNTLKLRNDINKAFLMVMQADRQFEYIEWQLNQHGDKVRQSAKNIIRLARRNINDFVSKFRREVGFEAFDELTEVRMSQDDSDQLENITGYFVELPKPYKDKLEEYVIQLTKDAIETQNK